MHANYLLAKSRTVTPQAPTEISTHIQAHVQTRTSACTLAGTENTHTHTHSGCHCSSSTHLSHKNEFTIETSEDLFDKLEGIPLTKAPVMTECRLMIDYIHHSAGRAEHGTSYGTLLKSHLTQRLKMRVSNYY